MQTASQATSPIAELERIADLLYRSLTANRFAEAQQYADECAALHSFETHATIMSILERAREIALAQRSLAALRLGDLHRAGEYLNQAGDSSSVRG